VAIVTRADTSAVLGGCSIKALVGTMTGRWLGFGVLLFLGVVGYVCWLNLTRGVRAVGQAAAMVTISGTGTDCQVRRNDGKRGSRVPCEVVSAYLRDRLNLSPGASVGIAALGKVPANAVAAVSKDLSMSGFKVAGAIRVGFISEPSGAR
jgi:hypothetical protein